MITRPVTNTAADNPLRCKMEIGMLGGIAGVVAGWLSGYAYRSWKYKRERKRG